MTEKIITQVIGLILSTICGYLVASLKAIKARQEEEKARQTALETGVQALLRQKLLELYDQYKDAEEVPQDAQEATEAIYKAYHGLGGNGQGTRLYTAIINKKTA